MKQRVFVGIKLSDALADEIAAWQGTVRHLPVRWIAPHNLHITFVPPWFQDSNSIDAVIKPLRSVASCLEPFAIDLRRVSFGPNPQRPRLIWAQGPYSRCLTAVREACVCTLEASTENRHYTPHITLARFRPETFSSFAVKTLDERVRWREDVRAITLFESRLSPAGAEYYVLETIALRAAKRKY